jgi:hypothetical protein
MSNKMFDIFLMQLVFNLSQIYLNRVMRKRIEALESELKKGRPQ